MHPQGLLLGFQFQSHIAAQVHLGATYFTEHKIVLDEINHQ